MIRIHERLRIISKVQAKCAQADQHLAAAYISAVLLKAACWLLDASAHALTKLMATTMEKLQTHYEPAIAGSDQNIAAYSRNTLADLNPAPFSRTLENRYRMKRFMLFRQIITDVVKHKKQCRVLDIGGTVPYWLSYGSDLNLNEVDITIVNIQKDPGEYRGIKVEIGDACDLKAFGDLSFDVVHSNSVIEHVGRWQDMAQMAKEIRRLAPRYFVQTPYFWFPIEPHARFPLLHWMPEVWRYRIIMNRSCGYWQRQPDLGEAVKQVQSALLLDRRQVQYLFPDAVIVPEKVFGFTKSLMAIR
jgi:hypothetical protein